MSSYCNIYIKHKDSDPFELTYFSRSHPAYRALYDNGPVVWCTDLNCKEWYEYSKHNGHSAPCKRVKTKAEAIEPIPENAEHDAALARAMNGEITLKEVPPAVYGGYFIEEEYDALPTKAEMIENNAAKLSKEMLSSIAESALTELTKAEKNAAEDVHVSRYEKILRDVLHEAFPNSVQVKDSDDYESDWDEYLDELRQAYWYLVFLSTLNDDIQVYCYYD